MPESLDADMEKLDQLYALERAISVFEYYVEGVAAKKIDSTATDANMAEAHFLYFRQKDWIKLFMGRWYTTEEGKNALSYLKMRHASLNET